MPYKMGKSHNVMLNDIVADEGCQDVDSENLTVESSQFGSPLLSLSLYCPGKYFHPLS
jgi:hypothetical protein